MDSKQSEKEVPLHEAVVGELPLNRVIADLAAKDPGAPAVICEGRTISRGELDERATRLAHKYEGLGVQDGDTVAIALPNCIEFYESMLATYKLGAVPLPLSYRLPRSERQAIVELANAKLIVGVDPSEHPDRQSVAAGFEPEPSIEATPVLPDRTSPVLSVTTSGGSTGRPKLMLATTSSAVNLVPMASVMGIQTDGCIMIASPLYHGSAYTFSLIGLAIGCPLVVLPRFDAVAALDAVRECKVDWVFLVPTMMSRMLRAIEAEPSRFDVSTIRMLMHGASVCPVWVKQGWIDLLGPEKVLEVYGASEAPLGLSITGTEWLDHRGSVGKPMFGAVKIVDEEFNQLPSGEIGEIFMWVPEGTPDKATLVGAEMRRRDGWTSVGDLGWMDDEGYLYISDRRVDMIVSGGANVFPAEVESVLTEHPKVVTAVVVGLPDDDLGQRVHAIVESIDAVTSEELLAFLADRLVRYKIPRSIRITNEALRDDAGKARRSAIRDAEIERLGLGPREGVSAR